MAVDEVWRDVPGYEGKYEVSNLGSVRSLVFRNGNVERLRPKPLVMGQSRPAVGYAHVMLCKNDVKKTFGVHKLVLWAFVGPRQPGTEATHLNGVKSDNSVGNLAWRTKTENEADKRRHGTATMGARHPRAKLNDDAVRAIRGSKGVESSSALAQRYRVSPSLIELVWKGRIWKHVA